MAQILPILAVAIYGVIRFGQQVFCNRLGVTPEELGLTYAASVSRAAVFVVALAVFKALAVIILMIFSLEPRNKRMSSLQLLFLIAASGAVLGGLTWVLGIFATIVVYVSLVVLALSTPPLIQRAISSDGGLDASWAGWMRRWNEPATRLPKSFPLVAVLILFTAVLFFLAGHFAKESAERIKDGKTVSVGKGVGLLGVHGEPVNLYGEAPKELDLANRTLMYLGHGGGYIVVYDTKEGKILRIPENGITIVSR